MDMTSKESISVETKHALGIVLLQRAHSDLSASAAVCEHGTSTTASRRLSQWPVSVTS